MYLVPIIIHSLFYFFKKVDLLLLFLFIIVDIHFYINLNCFSFNFGFEVIFSNYIINFSIPQFLFIINNFVFLIFHYRVKDSQINLIINFVMKF